MLNVPFWLADLDFGCADWRWHLCEAIARASFDSGGVSNDSGWQETEVRETWTGSS